MQPVISVGALQPSSLPAVSFVLNFTSHANRCQIRGETAPKPGVLAWGLLWPRVCESPSVSRADMPGSTLLTMENICTEHLKMLGCITHTSGTLCGACVTGYPQPGTGSQPGEFASLCAQLAMSVGFVVVTGWRVVYWHPVGTPSGTGPSPSQASPGPEVSSAGRELGPMLGQVTTPVVTLWLCGIAALKRRQMKKHGYHLGTVTRLSAFK